MRRLAQYKHAINIGGSPECAEKVFWFWEDSPENTIILKIIEPVPPLFNPGRDKFKLNNDESQQRNIL